MKAKQRTCGILLNIFTVVQISQAFKICCGKGLKNVFARMGERSISGASNQLHAGNQGF